jgi:hypothetical protein
MYLFHSLVCPISLCIRIDICGDFQFQFQFQFQFLFHLLHNRNIDFLPFTTLLLCLTPHDRPLRQSFLLPGVGEIEDVAWAPISAFIMKTLFESNLIGAYFVSFNLLQFLFIWPGWVGMGLRCLVLCYCHSFHDEPMSCIITK